MQKTHLPTQIGPNQLDDHMESVEDEYVEQVVSPRSSSPVNHFEDPQVLPRIGNEYQAEIPPLIARFDYLKITNKPADSKAQLDLSNYFSLGLPIQWRNCEVKKCNGKLDSGGVEQSRISLNNENSELKVKHLNPVLEDAKNVEEFSNLAPTVGRGLVLPLESNMKSWSKLEEDSFLLCLYIFRKNLRLVKRFIGSKEMGDILSFYYGTFYTSDGYRRWSECRKLKSRRCIHGKKIFTGWRQKELVSRLIPHVSKECQDMLMESSRYFVEGKISFEEYIFKLRILLASTSSEIIKFLTGNFRLSKARMNDLFWEAVWPRLLARGWHSEQPKQSLVFLVPGIEKFSRSLVKGNQYFDSVSDVLKNVASNPGILELDNEPPKGSESEDRKDRWDLPKSQGRNDLSNKQHHRYLLPRSVNGSRDLRKFTIVDTSMLPVAEKPKVRELRSLHVQTAGLSTLYNLSSENEQDSSKESEDYAEEANTSNPEEDMIDREAFVNSSYCVTSNVNTGMSNTPDPALVATENHESQITSLLNHESQSTSLLNDKCPSKIVKDKFSRKLTSGRLKYLAPIMKQKDLTDCKHGESSCSGGEIISVDRKPIQDESHAQSNLPNACEVMEYQVDPQHFSTASSLEIFSPGGSNERSVTANCLDREGSPEKSQPWTLIDLNLPPVSPDLGTDEPLIKCMMQNNDNSSENKSSSLSDTSEQPEPLKLPEVGESMEQQKPAIKSQRQSTRNRPLTTRAWEALELDFCRTKRKRKGETLQNKSKSRLQRDRGNTSASSVFDELQDRGEKRVKSL
ncbi:PREDICTED: Homeodomain [Prunus dulcis]|uniref:PREDICTED: Homeodomain n=1 Tax=Prunus dulcis TaxID=3755 RepID=A0A5E4EEL9_PRUDU|nr:PREDICTED: Homeodomain [Prunus dulcis]